MRTLKDGRVKLKFDEVRVGQVFYYEMYKSKDYIKDNPYILVTQIVKNPSGNYFNGLSAKRPDLFLVPDSIELKSRMYLERFNYPILKNMNLIDPDTIEITDYQKMYKGK